MRANSSDCGKTIITDSVLGMAIKPSLLDSPYRTVISLKKITEKLRIMCNINYRTQKKQFFSKAPEFVRSRKISTCTTERKPIELYKRSASAQIVFKRQSTRPATVEFVSKQRPQSLRIAHGKFDNIQRRKQIIIDETGTVFSRRIRL